MKAELTEAIYIYIGVLRHLPFRVTLNSVNIESDKSLLFLIMLYLGRNFHFTYQLEIMPESYK